jgi:branched-chain amino acid transport system permease protein
MLEDSVANEVVKTKPARAPAKPTPVVKKIFLGILALTLFLIPLLSFVGATNNYVLHMLLFVFMYIAMASSWNIIGGYAGYISLGHNVFFAIGGFTAGLLLTHGGISPFLSAPFAGLLAMALGFGVGLISLRTRGPAFIISTVAMLLVVKISFDNWDFIGGSNGISLPFLQLPLAAVKIPFYYGMLLIAIAAVYTSYRIRHSKFGLGLRAISQDETKAEVAGIRTRFYKILAFAISGLFIGMAGALWGYYLTYIRPDIFLTILIAAQLVLMTILGGKGTVAGPVVGAILFIAANEFFVSQLGFTELNIVATGLLMALVLLFFPAGIVGTLKEHGKLPQILDWD